MLLVVLWCCVLCYSRARLRGCFWCVFGTTGHQGDVLVTLGHKKTATNRHRTALGHSPSCASTGFGVIFHHPLLGDLPYARVARDTPASRTLVSSYLNFVRQGSWPKIKRGFLTATQSQPWLGLVVRCGDVAL